MRDFASDQLRCNSIPAEKRGKASAFHFDGSSTNIWWCSLFPLNATGRISGRSKPNCGTGEIDIISTQFRPPMQGLAGSEMRQRTLRAVPRHVPNCLMSVNLPAMAYCYQINLSSIHVKSVYYAVIADPQSESVRGSQAIMWIGVEPQAHRINSSLDIGLDCQRQLQKIAVKFT